ncbi:MAG: ABC transporter substrate-binding protein [Desulfobacteraceae bacterium]|nr:MAG: ABC transporter substrate-binding protein [Desulfobacteraceae bacterium]
MKKTFDKRHAILTLATIVCALALCLPAAAVVKLDMDTTYSGANMHAETCREFAKRVNEALKDQVFITVHEGGALGLKDEDRFTAVADGIVPIQSVLMGAAIGTSPIFGLSTSPFFVKDFKDARLLMEIARPYYDKEAKKHNQLILYTAPWPPSSIHANRPIIKYEDIKGLRIRTYDKNGTDVLKKAGANAVVMSWGDVYPALATKTIDSVLTSSQSAVAGKFWEVLTDTTRVNFAIPLNMININLDTFNKLSKEQQQKIVEIGKQMEERQWKLAEEAMVNDENTCEKNGMKITRQVSNELAGKLKADGMMVIEEWTKKVGPDAKSILDEFEKKRK